MWYRVLTVIAFLWTFCVDVLGIFVFSGLMFSVLRLGSLMFGGPMYGDSMVDVLVVVGVAFGILHTDRVKSGGMN